MEWNIGDKGLFNQSLKTVPTHTCTLNDKKEFYSQSGRQDNFFNNPTADENFLEMECPDDVESLHVSG